MGVVKNVPTESVRAALDMGLHHLGENRVQEAASRIESLGRDAAHWHMVGHLQRNKVGRAVELFDLIHSVDSAELAQALARRARSVGGSIAVLIEVNVGGEPSKFGVTPEALDPLAETVASLEGLSLEGLMTVAPPAPEPEQARPWYASLRELRERAERRIGRPMPQLSMGMSGDFEVAIEEGATMVRVGTTIFGSRN